MGLTREQKAELNLTKHKGLMADLVLEGENPHEERFAAIISEATRTLQELTNLLESIAALPNEKLYYQHEWADPNLLPPVFSFSQSANRDLIAQVGISTEVKAIIAQHELARQAFEEARRVLRERVGEAWAEKLPELLRTHTPASSSGEEPFDANEVGMTATRDAIADLEKAVPQEDLEDWFGAFDELARD